MVYLHKLYHSKLALKLASDKVKLTRFSSFFYVLTFIILAPRNKLCVCWHVSFRPLYISRHKICGAYHNPIKICSLEWYSLVMKNVVCSSPFRLTYYIWLEIEYVAPKSLSFLSSLKLLLPLNPLSFSDYLPPVEEYFKEKTQWGTCLYPP